MMQRRPIAVTTQPRKKPIWSFYTRLYHIYICMLHSIIRISPSWWHRFFSRFFSWRRSVVTTSVHCTLLTKTNDRRTNSNEDSGLGANNLTAGKRPPVTKKGKKRFAPSERTCLNLGKKRKWVVELQINVFYVHPPKLRMDDPIWREFFQDGLKPPSSEVWEGRTKIPTPRHTILCST